MATYTYVCKNKKKCGNVFEAVHGMNEAPIKICPKCGGKLYRKIYANPFYMDVKAKTQRFQ